MTVKKKLIETVRKYFPDTNIDPYKWSEILKNSSNNPSIFHQLNRVKYHVAYHSENASVDLSMILYEKQRTIGIMPLMVHKDENNKWVLSSNGEDIVEPIFEKISVNEMAKNSSIEPNKW